MADKSLNRDTSKLDPTTWDHGWGYRDTRLVVQPDECVMMTGSRYNLCGYPMPYLIPFVREELGFDIDFRTTIRRRMGRERMSPRHASRLADTGLQAGMSGRPPASARRPFPVRRPEEGPHAGRPVSAARTLPDTNSAEAITLLIRRRRPA